MLNQLDYVFFGFEMESERNIAKDVFISVLTKMFQVVIQFLFVCENPMILDVVVSHLHTFSFLCFYFPQVNFKVFHKVFPFALLLYHKFVLVCQDSLHVLIKKYSLVVSFLHLNFGFPIYYNLVFFSLQFFIDLIKVPQVVEYFLFRFLSPNKVSLSLIMSEGPPKSISKSGFYDLGIISFTNEYFVFFDLLTLIGKSQTVVDQRQEDKILLELLF